MPNPTGETSASVGFFGKLAGAGDFVQRRLPTDFVDRWDDHFQHAVAASREKLGEQWHETWHASPAWRFILSPGVCGDAAWAGVMAPAADRVGRCFPMVMAASLGSDAAACALTLRESQRWFDALEHVHAEARHHGAGADAFDARLASLPGPLQVTRSDPAAALQGTDWRTSAQWRMPLRVLGHDELFLEALWLQVAASGNRWCLWWSSPKGCRQRQATSLFSMLRWRTTTGDHCVPSVQHQQRHRREWWKQDRRPWSTPNLRRR
jgi:type VI secretion system protein ImpM